jgi:RNA polymerase sigma factor (sigma-70 family)
MYEDVYARLLLSLVEAVREYDAAKGIFFAAFVAAKLRYAVWNIFKKERRVWQNTISDSPDENGITLLEKISTSQSPEGDFVEKDVAARLKKGVAELSPLQRCVVEKLFFENKTLAEVGGELGVSPQAVYGIKLRALNNLRRRQDFKDLW